MSGKRKSRKRRIMQAKKAAGNGQDRDMDMELHKAEQISAMSEETKEAEQPAGIREEPEKKDTGTEREKPVRNLFLQYNNLEFSDKLMFEAAINDYCKKAGVGPDSIEIVNLYVKPQEGKAYYVINGDGEKNGSIDL